MTSRRNFLIATSLAASAASVTPLLVSAASDQISDLQFDPSRFRGIISRSATHRHLFAAGTIDRGFILSEMYNTLYTYDHWLSTPDSHIFAAAVLYHGMAVAMALEDAAWNELLVPGLQALPPEGIADIHTLPNGSGNPLLRRGPNGTAQQSLSLLASRGVTFFVCNSALSGLAMVLSRALNRTPRDVYAQLTGSLIHGATLVPTGVWAIHALQEAHFTYLQASL